MTYAVKEIFKTIQGEGYHAGRAARLIVQRLSAVFAIRILLAASDTT